MARNGVFIPDWVQRFLTYGRSMQVANSFPNAGAQVPTLWFNHSWNLLMCSWACRTWVWTDSCQGGNAACKTWKTQHSRSQSNIKDLLPPSFPYGKLKVNKGSVCDLPKCTEHLRDSEARFLVSSPIYFPWHNVPHESSGERNLELQGCGSNWEL